MSLRPPPARLEALALAYLESGQGASLLARQIVAARLRALDAHRPDARQLTQEERRALAREARVGLESLREEYLREAKEAKRQEKERQGQDRTSATDPPPNDRLDALSLKAFAAAAVHRAASAVVGAWGRLTGHPRWRWRTRRDDRVRPSHRRLEGKVFKLGEGDPVEGQAGDAWGCRCWMEPL